MMLEDTRRILAKEDAVADAVHRRAFGNDYQPPGEEDMGDINVGDTTIYQTPPQPQQPQSNLQTMLATAAIAAATGMGGYMLANRATPPQSQPQQQQAGFEYDSLKIGLGRIEDYITKAESSK
jgi:hypothetical protein